MDMNQEDVKRVEEVEARIGYVFRNKYLPLQALTRKAFANENEGAEHNELPEHFGDTVLELAIKRELLRKYAPFDEKGRLVSNMNEGQFSSMEDAYVNNAHLAACIDKLGLVPYIRFGKGEEKQNCAEQNKAKSNLFEAIVFVVWVDCEENMDTVTQVVLQMLGLFDQNDI